VTSCGLYAWTFYFDATARSRCGAGRRPQHVCPVDRGDRHPVAPHDPARPSRGRPLVKSGAALPSTTFRFATPAASRSFGPNSAFASSRASGVGLVGQVRRSGNPDVRPCCSGSTMFSTAASDDGQDIPGHAASLREAISVVPQTSRCSIARSWKISGMGARMRRMTKCCVRQSRRAAISWETLPEGLATMVGDRGRQVLGWPAANARDCACVPEGRADPAAGNEATAALDSEFRGGDPGGARPPDARGTVIAIAHRLATLRNFDRVVSWGPARSSKMVRRSA